MERQFKKGDTVQYKKVRKVRKTKDGRIVSDGQVMTVDDAGPMLVGNVWVGATQLPGSLVDLVGCKWPKNNEEYDFCRFEENELTLVQP